MSENAISAIQNKSKINELDFKRMRFYATAVHKKSNCVITWRLAQGYGNLLVAVALLVFVRLLLLLLNIL